MLKAIIVSALLLTAVALANAQTSDGAINITTAIQRATERFEGRVIAADFAEGSNDQPVEIYSLRILTPNGDIVQVIIDASDGTIVEANGRGLVDARKSPRGF